MVRAILRPWKLLVHVVGHDKEGEYHDFVKSAGVIVDESGREIVGEDGRKIYCRIDFTPTYWNAIASTQLTEYDDIPIVADGASDIEWYNAIDPRMPRRMKEYMSKWLVNPQLANDGFDPAILSREKNSSLRLPSVDQIRDKEDLDKKFGWNNKILV